MYESSLNKMDRPQNFFFIWTETVLQYRSQRSLDTAFVDLAPRVRINRLENLFRYCAVPFGEVLHEFCLM